MTLLFAHEVTVVVPAAGGLMPGLQAYAQAFYLDSLSACMRTINAVTVLLLI